MSVNTVGQSQPGMLENLQPGAQQESPASQYGTSSEPPIVACSGPQRAKLYAGGALWLTVNRLQREISKHGMPLGLQ